MKDDMKLIMESWRQTNLLESLSDAIKNKQLDNQAIEKISEKLSDNEGFKLAVQMFSAMSQIDEDEMGELDESAMNWLKGLIAQGYVDGNNLIDTLKSDSRFAPVLNLGGPALAMAFLAFKHEAGSITGSDFAVASEIVTKKGNVDIASLADAVLTEYVKKPRSHNGKKKLNY